MTTATIKSWGEALDYTWRVKWKRKNSAKTNAINSGHVTNYAGRSLPLARMTKAGWWMEFKAEMEDEGRSGSTINRILSAGTTVMKFTYLAGLHAHMCPQFERAKEGEHRLTYFSKEQISLMADIAVGVFERQDMADAIVFSAYTGVRQGELLKLRSDDVDVARSQIWVGGKPTQVTKGKNVRAIPLNEKVMPIVERRLGQTYLFRDDWANKDALYRVFKKVRKQAGIGEDYVWHSLRHSFGTFLGEVTHPRQIMSLMGHANVETSLRYVKATDAACRTAIMAI